MTSTRRFIGAVATGLALAVAGSGVTAAVVINVTEAGGGVDFMAAGSLNLTGAVEVGNFGSYGLGVIPGGTNFYIAPGPGAANHTYAMSPLSGPFGTSTSYFNSPTTESGDSFFIWGDGGSPQVGVSNVYVSGAAISSDMFFAGMTFAGFTLIPGTYEFALPSDHITLNIGAVTPAPEPSGIALTALALSGLACIARRRAKRIG